MIAIDSAFLGFALVNGINYAVLASKYYIQYRYNNNNNYNMLNPIYNQPPPPLYHQNFNNFGQNLNNNFNYNNRQNDNVLVAFCAVS